MPAVIPLLFTAAGYAGAIGAAAATWHSVAILVLSQDRNQHASRAANSQTTISAAGAHYPHRYPRRDTCHRSS